MDFLTPASKTCSICGTNAFSHSGWFLVMENRWLDHLKIFTWHPSLASQEGISTVCCRSHLRAVIANWLDQPRLQSVSPENQLPFPITSDASRRDPEIAPHSAGYLIAQLCVHRETFSRVWTGSPATLECILDALIPAIEDDPTPEELLFSPRFASRQEVALH